MAMLVIPRNRHLAVTAKNRFTFMLFSYLTSDEQENSKFKKLSLGQSPKPSHFAPYYQILVTAFQAMALRLLG
jgi:hypothetical protein